MPAAGSRTRRQPSRRAPGVAHLGGVRRPEAAPANRADMIFPGGTLLQTDWHRGGGVEERGRAGIGLLPETLLVDGFTKRVAPRAVHTALERFARGIVGSQSTRKCASCCDAFPLTEP